ncbi:MAG: InlB B-repeat-containing protein, partial [Micrococcales bacterium]
MNSKFVARIKKALVSVFALLLTTSFLQTASLAPALAATRYTVTYTSGGAPIGTAPVDASSPYTSLTGRPVKVTALGVGTLENPGYVFNGWDLNSTYSTTCVSYFEGDTFNIGKDASLAAIWDPTVTYHANLADVTGTVPTDSGNDGLGGYDYCSSSTVTVLGNTGTLAKANYKFAGWATSSTATTPDYTAGDTFSITTPVDLYAVWYPALSLSYDANGGSGAPTDSTVYYHGDSATLDSNAPTTAPLHKHFGGWSLDGSLPSISSVTFDASNITVKAIWLDDNSYTLTYDANGGSGAPSDSGVYYNGDTKTLDTNGPSGHPTHQHFGGWSLTGSGPSISSVTFSNSDITVKAIWLDDPTYSLTYDANGGSGAPSDSTVYYSGDNPTLDTNGPSTAPSHKHFGGWSLNAGGSQVTDVTFDSSNITVYAIWESDTTYTLSYDANGGSGAPSDVTGNYSGDTVTLDTNGPSGHPTHQHFGGWSLDGNTPSISSVTFDGADITVYAIWLDDTTYSLSYNANGGSGA